MYAVIQTGGKQYQVCEGDKIKVEKLEAQAGTDIEFGQVLLVVAENQQKIGTPYVENAQVMARVEEHGRGKKIRIIKFRRRKHYMKRQGHRQWYTELRITGIQCNF